MFKDIIKPTIVLTFISVVVAVILAVTYNFTGIGELGQAIPQKELDEYIVEVLPKGSKLVAVKQEVEMENILGIYKDETNEGVAVYSKVNGYHEFNMLVGLNMNGEITGVKILESTETPGIGTKIENKDFINEFIGKNEPVKFKKDGGDIDAIAGATYSSSGFIEGINKAIEVFETVKGSL